MHSRATSGPLKIKAQNQERREQKEVKKEKAILGAKKRNLFMPKGVVNDG